MLADSVLREIKQSRCYKVQKTEAEVTERLRYKLLIFCYVTIALDEWVNANTYNTIT